MSRKRLATVGERGKLVKLYLEEKAGARRYVVQWGPRTARQQESWPATKAGKLDAETFFKAFTDEVQKPASGAEPLTNRQLWRAFADSEFEHLRANTTRLYTEAWRYWESFTPPSSIAGDTSIHDILRFRKALDDRGLATATVKGILRAVRGVFNWGERMELIDRNRWHLFVHKVGKEKRTKARAEYRADEFARLWAALDPEKRGQWRAWVAVGLLGLYGNRQHEILNLRWSWIGPDRIDIDRAFHKTGAELSLKLFAQTRRLLDVARAWAQREGYAGDLVLFAGQAAGRRHPSKQVHYSIQSLTDAIHRAEARAQVETIRWRAGHGFRRFVVGDLADATGDVTLALLAIGDTDLRQAATYRSRRDDKIDAALERRANQLIPATLTTSEES